MPPVRRLAALAVLLTLVSFTSLPAAAQGNRPAEPPEELSADRPGFGESTDTVGAGFLQLEGGLLSATYELSGASLHDVSTPLALLRTGITRRLELRLANDGFLYESYSEAGLHQSHSGHADLSVGMKARLLREGRIFPALAVLGELWLPVGSSYFSSGGRDPEFHVSWSKSLPRGYDASGNFNFAWQTGGPRWTFQHAASFQVGHRLAAGLHGYGEVYRESPIKGDEAAQVVASGGVARPVGANGQIDVEAGHTLKARTPSWFFGAGFAVRIPLAGRFRRR